MKTTWNLIRKFQVCSIALLSIAVLLSSPARAVVYTSSNELEGNRVIAFDVEKASGQLTEIGSFETGGTGTGVPLGNQAAMATDASDRWMFVTNAGDGTVTSFRLQPDGLQLVNRIHSGGHSAISVTVFGTLVYVLNEGSGDSHDDIYKRYDNISGFRFNNVGELEAIEGSTRILNEEQLTAPAQIGFNKSGTVLLITEKATNTITTFVVDSGGSPAFIPLKRPSAVPTPFGFQFGDRDYVFITEANGGDQGVTASYRVNRETGEVSDLVDLIHQGAATCWTVLSSDETIGYSINTATRSISPYRINFDGTLDPFFRNVPDYAARAGLSPRDAVLTQNNQFLYVLSNGSNRIDGYFVHRDGSFIRNGIKPVTVPASVSGILAR